MTREELLSLSATDVRPVKLGKQGTVYVRSLSVADTEHAKAMTEIGTPWLVAWVLLCACDADGTRLFADADAEVLAKMPAKYVKTICTEALKLNGFAPDELEGDAKN